MSKLYYSIVNSHTLQGGKTWISNCNPIVNVLIPVFVLQGFCLANAQFNLADDSTVLSKNFSRVNCMHCIVCE